MKLDVSLLDIQQFQANSRKYMIVATVINTHIIRQYSFTHSLAFSQPSISLLVALHKTGNCTIATNALVLEARLSTSEGCIFPLLVFFSQVSLILLLISKRLCITQQFFELVSNSYTIFRSLRIRKPYYFGPRKS